MRRTSTNPSALRSVTDRELVVAFQEGDRLAYDEVYHRYQARVRRICSRMLNNAQDVDEATQETFLKAYQALGRFNGSYQLGAWLARIASNVCVDHVRFKVRSAQLVALSPEHETLGAESGPEDVVVGNNPRVDAAITGLAPLHAEALRLRALGGLSHEEMAGRLEMTPAQVKALLHRARTSFKRAWEKAEGWAFAPFLALRNAVADRSESSSATNLMAGPTFGPLFAERVATSAVIVVVALAGVPHVSPAPVAPSDPLPPAAVDFAPHGGARPPRAEPAPVAAPAPRRRATLLPSVTSLLGQARDTLDAENRDDDGDEDDGNVGTAETEDVVNEVMGTVREVIGDPGALLPPALR